MNLLTIILCVLIEATVIISKTERLSSTNSSVTLLYSDINLNKFIDIRSIPLSLIPYQHYPRSSKSLYNYNYKTDTGIQAHEDGHLKNVGTDLETLEVRGSYSYIDNEDNTFQVSYVANENGFQPEGAHLPTVPPLIKKVLQYIAEHPKENGKE